MRRWIVGLLAGLACAVGMSAYAVTTGGFPSRPWLQALGVGEAAPAIAGAIAASGPVESFSDSGMASIGTGRTGVFLMGGNQASINLDNSAAPVDQKVWQIYVDGSGTLHDTLINDAANTGSDWMDVSRSGTSVSIVNFPSGTLEAKGNPVSYGVIAGNTSGCALQTGYANSNIASCSRPLAGEYQVRFSNAYASDPTCTATVVLSSPYTASVAGASTTGITVYTYSGGTQADSTFSLQCE